MEAQTEDGHNEHKCSLTRETVEEDKAALEFSSLTASLSDYEKSVCSIQSEGDVSSGSESLELFQPSSPFKVAEEFILPDIAEESEEVEEVEGDTTFGDSLDKSDLPSLHSSLDEGELDIKETSFSNEHFFSDMLSALPQNHQTEELTPDFEPPTLPISPPPGPLLSPELKATPEATVGWYQQPPLEKYNPKNFRRSVAGALEDLPPPLPMTQPPGRLISPRHSSGFLDLAELNVNARKTSNGPQLVLKMNRVSEEARHEPSEATEEDVPALKEETQSVTSDDVLTLVPPPIQDHPDGEFDDEADHSITRQRLGSYHLKTFEPPMEFSDSGFQDTDTAATYHGSGDTGAKSSPKTTLALDGEDRGAHSPTILVTNTGSAVTCMSDEQLTENSGSTELKTFASSGSEVGETDNQ